MEKAGIQTILRQPTVLSAVAIRQDRLAAGLLADFGKPRGDSVERFVPAYATELTAPLGAGAHRRIENTIRSVHEFRKMPNFPANDPGSQRVGVVSIERFASTVADRHIQTAAIGAIKRTGTFEDFESRFGHD